jgi:REP-associated tyrosine transposase
LRVKNYRKGSHTVYLLHYHFVFIPKYRKPILRGDVGHRLRELIRMICHANEIEIVQGHIRPEHVHLLLSVPPNLAPSRVMQAIKGKTSNQLLREFRALNKEFWGRQCAGINRHGEGDERALRRRVSNPPGPESCAGFRKGTGEALTGAHAGRANEPRKHLLLGADAVVESGRQDDPAQHRERGIGLARSKNSGATAAMAGGCMRGISMRENREIPCSPVADGATGRDGKARP